MGSGGVGVRGVARGRGSAAAATVAARPQKATQRPQPQPQPQPQQPRRVHPQGMGPSENGSGTQPPSSETRCADADTPPASRPCEVDLPESDMLSAAHAAYARCDYVAALAYLDGAERALASEAESASASSSAELSARLSEALEARCRTHLALGNVFAALPDGAAAASLRPMWVDAFVSKAEAMLELEMWAGAREALERAHELGLARGHGPAPPRCRLADAGPLLERAREALRSCARVGVAHAGSAVHAVAFRHPHPMSHLHKGNGGGAGSDAPLVAGGCKSGLTFVWRAPSGELLAALEGHEAPVTALAWCPDGSTLLATASEDATARLWLLDVESGGGECVAVLAGHCAPLRSIAFDAYGAALATAGDDRVIRLWDAHTGLLRLATASLHKKTINRVVFSPSGRQLASASDDEDVRVWDLVGDVEGPGECLHTMRWTAGPVNELMYTPCGRMVVFATHCAIAGRVQQNRLLVFSAISGRILRYHDAHLCAISALAFKPGRDEGAEYDTLLSASLDGTIVEWEIKGEPVGEGKPETVIDAHKGRALSGKPLRCVQSSLRGMGEVHLNGGCFSGAWFGVAYSPDGARFAAVSLDGSLRLFVAASKALLCEWHCGEPQRHVAFSADGKVLLTADDTGRVSLWDPDASSEGELAKEYRAVLRLIADGKDREARRAFPAMLDGLSVRAISAEAGIESAAEVATKRCQGDRGTPPTGAAGEAGTEYGAACMVASAVEDKKNDAAAADDSSAESQAAANAAGAFRAGAGAETDGTPSDGDEKACSNALLSAAQANALLEELGDSDEVDDDSDEADPGAYLDRLGALKPKPNRGENRARMRTRAYMGPRVHAEHARARTRKCDARRPVSTC